MHLKDEYITKSTFEDGASVSFSCAPGYTSAGGSPRITCSAGAWSTLQLKCESEYCLLIAPYTSAITVVALLHFHLKMLVSLKCY